ncbi:MAG TPA: hypothetical protein PLV68_16275, partial [Ilumatobacteraceae bacterium]|nr:hypothetical protein [Ilumatobacteraceae bacterium]
VLVRVPNINFRWTTVGADSDLVGQVPNPPGMQAALSDVTVATGESDPVNGGITPIPRLNLTYFDGLDSIPGTQR